MKEKENAKEVCHCDNIAILVHFIQSLPPPPPHTHTHAKPQLAEEKERAKLEQKMKAEAAKVCFLQTVESYTFWLPRG